ncbi:hypothetical protein LTR10_022222 [Elasticomyces elasticus]|uniref:Transcription factor domain-containing protein n=1 Tax=Exophiala sideris TaxID=1016849 RepID=A0ABR0JJ13_9EURO|nr:hypothetical protein LTR10_022222 [Elasticomyces elasticus]KAK5034400.1 hypothetical protein LTS07_003321 [Exophiala sideris]KAK5042697.1 hypothetical protein LTR13_001545 [Exophiala sideris]KAK5065779.1 hypothetical protein LTR69_003329 [Exophiala sideris]KAK5185761.1 hypothetical protein LTR44_001810 [Eurotiomycetes sp. CCFEE 6388]
MSISPSSVIQECPPSRYLYDMEAGHNTLTSRPVDFAPSHANTFDIGFEAGIGDISGVDFQDFELVDQEFWHDLSVPWTLDSPAPNLPEPSSPVSQTFGVNQPADDPPIDSLAGGNEDARILLRHYFENVCRINSVFDTSDNPFRYLVLRYIKSSSLIRNCVLGLALVHRMQSDRQNMHRKVVRYHSAALQCLSTAIENLEVQESSIESADQSGSTSNYLERLQEALLGVLLLCNSSSWLDPEDIGIGHLLSARKLFGKWLHAHRDSDMSTITRDREASFIVGAMAYLETVVAFVLDQPLNAADYLEPFCHQSNDVVHPNPWTGVSTPIFITMARVGICVRQRRAISKLRAHGWSQKTYETMLNDVFEKVKRIESDALIYEPPARGQTQTKDQMPLSNDVLAELECLAYTYKLASLLELYRSFPELGARSGGKIQLPTAMVSEDADAPSLNEHSRLIYDLAINLLGLLKATAERQATSLIHTLALLISGSALYKQSEPSDNNGTCLRGRVTHILSIINMRPPVVDRWRSFVRERVRSNADFVGLESFKKVETLLDEVWKRLDDPDERLGHRSAHWLDVMTECHLETIFG